MHIVACLRMIFQRIVKAIFKRRVVERANEVILREKYELMGFSNKQMNVIDRGLLAGVDVSVYAKKCFNDNQMKVLLCGLLMEVDVKEFAHFSMSSLEMEYHLYMKVIDTYLGADYLSVLLSKGEHTIADKYIKDIIERDLKQAFNEVASTNALPERSAENIEYTRLCNNLKIRGIKSKALRLDTISNMRIMYRRIVTDYIRKLKNNFILRTEDNFNCCTPSVRELRNRSEDDIDKEVIVISNNGKECTYYQVNYNGNIYLLGAELVPIKII